MSLREVGDRGEKLAISYLKEKGYKILKTNFELRMGEIDIIAQKEQTLCFIEVKMRSSIKFGFPFESVHSAKQKRISIAASVYLSRYRQKFEDCRFDVLSILMDNPIQIEHFEGAFDSLV